MVTSLNCDKIKEFFTSLYKDETSKISVEESNREFEVTITLYYEACLNFGKMMKVSEFFGTSDFDVKTEHWEYSEYTQGEDIFVKDIFVIYTVKKSNLKV